MATAEEERARQIAELDVEIGQCNKDEARYKAEGLNDRTRTVANQREALRRLRQELLGRPTSAIPATPEICGRLADLAQHREVVSDIEHRLFRLGFLLGCSDHDEISSIVWPEDGIRVVRLGMKNRGSGLDALFDLLHELGHAESGQPDDDRLDRSERQRRELDAWARAEENLKAYGLAQYIERFRQRSAQCLASYGVSADR